MVRPIWYTTPASIHGDELFRKLGREWTCPYCKAEHAKADGATDIGWVETSLRTQSPRYICSGCAHDIYGTCAEDDFDSHPYKGIVQEAASIERISGEDFRKVCVEDQVRILNLQLEESESPELRQCRDRLLVLLTEL
jgi:hypothetical protein